MDIIINCKRENCSHNKNSVCMLGLDRYGESSKELNLFTVSKDGTFKCRQFKKDINWK